MRNPPRGSRGDIRPRLWVMTRAGDFLGTGRPCESGSYGKGLPDREVRVTDSVYDNPEWWALVAGIRANPDDDLPRLVAADWLEERGEELRAELIRLQCESAAMPRCSGWATLDGCDCRRCDIIQAAFALIQAEHEMWHSDGPDDTTYARGFWESVRCPWSWWAESGDTLCRREPIQRVELTTEPTVFSAHTSTVPHDVAFWLDNIGGGQHVVTITERELMSREHRQEDVVRKLLNSRWPAIPVHGWMLPVVFAGAEWATANNAAPLEDIRRLADRMRNNIIEGLSARCLREQLGLPEPGDLLRDELVPSGNPPR